MTLLLLFYSNCAFTDESIVLIISIVFGIPTEAQIKVQVSVGLAIGLIFSKILEFHGVT